MMTNDDKLKWAKDLPCQFFGDIMELAEQETDTNLAERLESIANSKYHDDEYYSSEYYDYEPEEEYDYDEY